jgi:hypothetical protein
MFLLLPYVVFFICSILKSSLQRDSNGFFAPPRKIIYLSLSGTLRLARCLNQDSYNTKAASAEACQNITAGVGVSAKLALFLRQTQIPVKEKPWGQPRGLRCSSQRENQSTLTAAKKRTLLRRSVKLRA